MKLTWFATVALACACGAVGLGSAASAAVLRHTAVPAGFQPRSTAWLTPRQGMVIGYTSTKPGAPPTLLGTGDGGRTWTRLPAPPVPLPDNGDVVQVTWADAADAFVTDGMRIAVTHDDAKHWTRLALPAAGSGQRWFVNSIAIFGHRVFVLTERGDDGAAAVFSGAADASALRPVPGLSVSGDNGFAYGSLAVGGGVQVYLGTNYRRKQYWVSSNGDHFHPAPAPCPVTQRASLAGVLAGKAVALCSGPPSDIGIGEDEKQLSVAARLGGTFHPSGVVSDSENTEGFGAVSAQDATIVNAFALLVTFDGGKTWALRIPQDNGAVWSQLDFPDASTGYTVSSTITKAGTPSFRLYRTANGGHTWQAVAIT